MIWMVAVVVDGDGDSDGDNENNKMVEMVETISKAVDNGNGR
jgi:hypothetical protein